MTATTVYQEAMEETVEAVFRPICMEEPRTSVAVAAVVTV